MQVSIWHRMQSKASTFREVELNDVYSPYHHLPRLHSKVFLEFWGVLGIHPLVNIKSQPPPLSVCCMCVCYVYVSMCVLHYVYHVCQFSPSTLHDLGFLFTSSHMQIYLSPEFPVIPYLHLLSHHRSTGITDPHDSFTLVLKMQTYAFTLTWQVFY